MYVLGVRFSVLPLKKEGNVRFSIGWMAVHENQPEINSRDEMVNLRINLLTFRLKLNLLKTIKY